MVRRILRTRLKSGFVFRFGVKKETGNYIAGFKAFKVNKREDGWIEIRDAGNWKLFGLVKRFETRYGALYLGFGVDKRPLAYFRPYIRRIDNVRKCVSDIHKHFPFVRLHWTLRGGSETGRLFNFRTEIIDLFRFVRFLSPIPSDVSQIVPKTGIPKFWVCVLSWTSGNVLRGWESGNVLRGWASGNVLMGWESGNVLRVREVPIVGSMEILSVRKVPIVGSMERGKYQVLGGYIPSSSSFGSGIIKVDVRSCKTFMAVVSFSGFAGKVLQCCVKKEVSNNDRQN